MTITAGGPFGSAHFFVLEVHPMHHSQKRYKTLYFFAALIAAAFSVLLIELGGIGDSDYYWHIVLGREICSTHTIPGRRCLLLDISGFRADRDRAFMAKQHHPLSVLVHFF